MLRLEKVTGRNVWRLIKLRVSEEQTDFVAPNDMSIIEAYVTVSAGGTALPFGIYDDDLPVGFLMIGYGADDEWEDVPEIAEGNYNIWRLMIDEKHQGRGYGRRALELALDFIRTKPCGEGRLVWLSYEPTNETARRLYHTMGFRETGEMDGDEIIAAREID